MKYVIAVLAFALASVVYAQDKAPPTPKAPDSKVSTGGPGAVCDSWAIVDTDVDVGGTLKDGGLLYAFGSGIPYADVQDNHRRGVVVLNAIAQRQDKGGPYTVTVGEWRSCEGTVVKIADGSIEARGITLQGQTEIMDIAIAQMQGTNNDRFKQRAKRGDRYAQDHGKARASKRDDMGRKVRD